LFTVAVDEVGPTVVVTEAAGRSAEANAIRRQRQKGNNNIFDE
jgi:hypothetical protein